MRKTAFMQENAPNEGKMTKIGGLSARKLKN
jgi:hypothetical protein